MPVSDLVFRLSKGSPLTAQEMDDNLRTLRDFANALESLFTVAFNSDGSLKNSPILYGESSTGSDSYAFTAGTITDYNQLIGRLVMLKADVPNSGTATLAINGLTAVLIKKYGTNTSLNDYDIKAGEPCLLAYDGTYFQLVSFPSVAQPANYGQDVGSANNYRVNQSGFTAAPTAANGIQTGFDIAFKAANTNTGASTLQLGSGGTIPIKKNINQDLAAGDITAGQVIRLIYDGTNFQIPANPQIRGSAVGPLTDAAWSGSNTHTVTLTLSAQADVIITAYANVSIPASQTGTVALTVDGSTQDSLTITGPSGSSAENGAVLITRMTLAAGAHTVVCKGDTSANIGNHQTKFFAQFV